MGKYRKVESKLPLGPKKKPLEELTKSSRYQRLKFQKDPEARKKRKNYQQGYYQQNKPKLSRQKSIKRKEQFLQVLKILGGKCTACGEKYHPKFKPTNLEVHHLFYDEEDLLKKSQYSALLAASNLRDVLAIEKNGKDPKKKFCLLCSECHRIETFIKQNPKKARHTISWLAHIGVLDKSV